MVKDFWVLLIFRMRVVYRLVKDVLILVVGPPSNNTMYSMQLAESVMRMLVTVGKGTNVTPDVIQRNLFLVSLPCCVDAFPSFFFEKFERSWSHI